MSEQAALEEAAKSVCSLCKDGHIPALINTSQYAHGHAPCLAQAIRALMDSGKEEE